MKDKEIDKVKSEMIKKEKEIYKDFENVRKTENDRVQSIINQINKTNHSNNTSTDYEQS